MTIVVVPLRISFVDWVASLSSSLPFALLPQVDVSEEKWRQWAKLFVQLNNFHLPYPADNQFKGKDGWRQWACLTLPILETL